MMEYLKLYILKNKKVRKATSEEMGTFMQTKKHILKQTTLKNGVFVSTIFLGLDHSWGGGAPILFETMVFKNKSIDATYDSDQERYTTYKEAMAGHKRWVQEYKK